MKELNGIVHVFGDTTDGTVAELPDIVVLGLGSAGCNMVGALKRMEVPARLIACDTNQDHLEKTDAPLKLLLKSRVIKDTTVESGLDYGLDAVSQAKEKIKDAIRGADILIVISSYGGSTGTGASIGCAEIARKMGISVIGIISTPFFVESQSRRKIAEMGIEGIKTAANAVFVLPNDLLLKAAPHLPMKEAFNVMNHIISIPINSFTNVVVKSDIKPITDFIGQGREGSIGFGQGEGRYKFNLAAKEALEISHLEGKNAKKGLLFVTMGPEEFREDIEYLLNDIHKRHPGMELALGLSQNDESKALVEALLMAME